MLTPCPAGWRERPTTDDGPATCDPWPEGGAEDCGLDEAHFPGEPGCSRVGTECPAGDFPEALPTDAPVLYVLSGASGGDGSSGLPFGTVSEANSAAPSGTVIAIGKGRYDELVRSRGSLTFWGACVAETLLTSSMPDPTVGVVAANRSGPVTIRNLRIGESARPAVSSLSRSAELRLLDVVVDRATGAAIASAWAPLHARNLAVRDSQPSGEALGRGVLMNYAHLELERAVIERTRLTGLVVTFSSAVRLRDVAIRNTTPQELDRVGGRGAQIFSADDVDVERVVIDDNVDVGLQLGGSVGRLRDLVVRRVRSQEVDGIRGRGLEIVLDSDLTLSRVLIEDAASIGLNLDDGARVRAADLVACRVSSRLSDGTFGRLVNVEDGSTLELERALLTEGHEGGVLANTQALVSLADVNVEDVFVRECIETTCSDAGLGIGLGAYREAAIDATRFVVSRAALCGVQIALDGVVDLTDGEIAGSAIGACLQVDGFDVSRLTDGVRYRDNGTNLTATTLPLPEPG